MHHSAVALHDNYILVPCKICGDIRSRGGCYLITRMISVDACVFVFVGSAGRFETKNALFLRLVKVRGSS